MITKANIVAWASKLKKQIKKDKVYGREKAVQSYLMFETYCLQVFIDEYEQHVKENITWARFRDIHISKLNPHLQHQMGQHVSKNTTITKIPETTDLDQEQAPQEAQIPLLGTKENAAPVLEPTQSHSTGRSSLWPRSWNLKRIQRVEEFNRQHTTNLDLQRRLEAVELRLSSTTIVLAISQILFILKTACDKAYHLVLNGSLPTNDLFSRPSKSQVTQVLLPYTSHFNVQAFWREYENFNREYRADLAHMNLPVIQSITIEQFRSVLEGTTTSDEARDIVNNSVASEFIGKVDGVMAYIRMFKRDCDGMISRKDAEDHWARKILGRVQ
ncbi:hypothetical protein AKO1_012510 [Acrasis kona]|uniref:EF-hand domain-containing protein n=1 Tax=Acrasis kona TaxID=1008807 RepID=A0AAW2YX44_9EUKA